MSLNAGMHLGQLLQQKLQEQNMSNEEAMAMNYVLTNQQTIQEQNVQEDNQATITSLQQLVEELKEKLENQRSITKEWADHSRKVEGLYDNVKHIIEEVIYDDSFKEHIQRIAQEIIDRNGFNNTIDYSALAENINYDAIVSKIDLGELASDHIDMYDLAQHVAENVDVSDIASEIDLADLANNLDMSDLADNMSYSDVASELSNKIRVDVTFGY